MSEKIILELVLDDDKFIVNLDPKSRKNLNIRIKPNNVIHVSKPAYVTKQKLIKYLEDHKDWIFKQSLKVNELHHARNSYIKNDLITVFGEEMSVDDFRNVDEELEIILSGYIDQRRGYYDSLLNQKPTIAIKKMKGKWGYCVPSKNEIFFNQKLVHYPKEVIDYVILHEYTHLKIPNHSKDFYDFVKADMPDYRKHIKYLRGH